MYKTSLKSEILSYLAFGHVEARHVNSQSQISFIKVPIAIMMSLFNEQKMTSRKKYLLNAHTKKYSERTHIKTATNKDCYYILLHLYFVDFYCLFGSMRGHFCMNSQNGILMDLI